MLSKIVEKSGLVVGVDHDPAMIEEANQYAKQQEVASWTYHQLGDAGKLSFPDNAFDAGRSERLFKHLLNPDHPLTEMIRVARPDGRIVVVDADWGSLSINTTFNDIERRLVWIYAGKCHNNGYSGRQLYGMFQLHRLEDVHIVVFPNFITDFQVAKEGAEMERLRKHCRTRRRDHLTGMG